ncbi:MAG TPA: glycoside hydrolase family 127 protein [Ferruginibacter sp.]|nr:glycoside hydrolase family 127 protein [Ferruginibacter sp.]
MKKLVFLLPVFAATFVSAQQKDYAIRDVNFTQVHLSDNFWLPRIEINRTVTIPASFERCENTGRVKNFVMAAEKKGKFCTRYPFDDTDIYKTIEGASFTLATHPDKKLDRYVDSLIGIIKSAQESDGYLYTARTIDPLNVGGWVGKERWEKERELSHELYNAGHLYEAAAAHYLATKKRNLLDVALKNADLVCSVFGPGKRSVAPGHEIVEMGLVKLYRITGKQEYLNTAKFFIYARGQYRGYDPKSKDSWKNGSYWQDDKPVTQQSEAVGHAVRAGYLYSAVADVAALTGDDSLTMAIDRIWENVVTKKLYVQGSVGAIGDGERYGENYELPNSTAYNETCAAIANVYWNYRMFLLHGDSKYMDVLEKTLYNGLISGVGLDGKSFFYTNAMEIRNSFSHADIERERSGWFECSCCPTNVCRFVPAVPGYMYAQKGDQLYVNLFISSTADLSVNGRALQLTQQNNYPWEGKLSFTVNTAKPNAFSMLLRIPGWAMNTAVPSDLYRFDNNINEKPEIKVNGIAVAYDMQNGYAVVKREWKKNDVLELNLPMMVRKVLANDNVKNDMGKLAIQRGPIMYCAEWADNNGRTSNIIIPAKTDFSTQFREGKLNGIMQLTASVPVLWIRSNESVMTEVTPVTLIPYYSWANRGKGEMMLWFPAAVKNIEIMPK